MFELNPKSKDFYWLPTITTIGNCILPIKQNKNRPRWELLAYCIFMTSLFVLPANAAKNPFPSLGIQFASGAPCATEQQFFTELEHYLSDWQGTSDFDFRVRISTSSMSTTGTQFLVQLAVTNKERVFQREVLVLECPIASKVAALLVAITLDPLVIGELEDDNILEALESPHQRNSDDHTHENQNVEKTPTQTDTPVIAKKQSDPTISSPPTSAIPSNNEKDNPRPPSLNTSTSSTNPKASDTSIPLFQKKLSVSLTSSFFVLPTWNAGPSIDGALVINRFCLFAGGNIVFSGKKTISSGTPGNDAWFKMTMASIVLGTGISLGKQKWHTTPSMGVAAHLLYTQSGSINSPVSNRQWVGAPWIGVTLSYLIRPNLGLSLSPRYHFLLADTQFNVAELGTVHSTGHSSLFTDLGIFYFF